MDSVSKDMLNINFNQMVRDLSKPGDAIQKTLSASDCHNIHMLLGISGEIGEIVDALKKSIIYRKPLDMENVIEEFGDIEFYLQGLRSNLGITREDTLKANLTKLLTGDNARYASGEYSNQQAQDRADK